MSYYKGTLSSYIFWIKCNSTELYIQNVIKMFAKLKRRDGKVKKVKWKRKLTDCILLSLVMETKFPNLINLGSLS